MGTPFASRNQALTTLPNHSTPKNLVDRKKVLQFTSDGDKILKEQKRDLSIASKENSMKSGLFSSSPVKVYKDKTLPPECPVTLCHRDAQTDDSLLDALLQERLSIPEIDSGRGSTLNDQDAIDMLTNDTPSETYWKDLAEERRRALTETLQENKELCALNESLREENTSLREIANKAEALEELLKEVMPDEGCGSGDEDDEQLAATSGTDNLDKCIAGSSEEI